MTSGKTTALTIRAFVGFTQSLAYTKDKQWFISISQWTIQEDCKENEKWRREEKIHKDSPLGSRDPQRIWLKLEPQWRQHVRWNISASGWNNGLYRIIKQNTTQLKAPVLRQRKGQECSGTCHIQNSWKWTAKAPWLETNQYPQFPSLSEGHKPSSPGKTSAVYAGPQSRQTRQCPDEGTIQRAWALRQEGNLAFSRELECTGSWGDYGWLFYVDFPSKIIHTERHWLTQTQNNLYTNLHHHHPKSSDMWNLPRIFFFLHLKKNLFPVVETYFPKPT